MLIKEKKHAAGFTLVETIITVVILSIAALGIMKFLISTQFIAEDNLYESTALTVALSTLEQMKNKQNAALDDSLQNETFDLETSGGKTVTLNLLVPDGPQFVPTVLEVPIVTKNTGGKNLDIRITPSITLVGADAAAGARAYMLKVQCEYDHPKTGRNRTVTVKCMRSSARTY